MPRITLAVASLHVLHPIGPGGQGCSSGRFGGAALAFVALPAMALAGLSRFVPPGAP